MTAVDSDVQRPVALTLFAPLVLWILVVVAVFALERLEFLLTNWSVFGTIALRDLLGSFVVGLRFDISFTLAASLPFLALALLPFPRTWQSVLRDRFRLPVLYAVWMLLWLSINFADAHYYRFSGRRSDVSVLQIAGNDLAQLPQLVAQYWFVLIAALVGGMLFVVFAHWSARRRELSVSWRNWFLLLLISAGAIVFGIRGGMQAKPLRTTHAYVFENVALGDLALNTPYVVVRTKAQDRVPRVRLFSRDSDYLRALPRASVPEPAEPMQHDNVVILIVESLGEEFMGRSPSMVPFLDGLANRGLYFETNYANGRRSIEAVPSIVMGIPSLMDEPYITSRYVGNHVIGLGTVLAQQGYRTLFFHGGKNGTMHFDHAAGLSGFREFFGRSEYDRSGDDDGAWGIFDGAFLDFTSRIIGAGEKPFVATVFTLSSHNPYRVPDSFHEGKELSPFRRSLLYADRSIELFVADAMKAGWGRKTLFIVTGDHTAEGSDPRFQTQEGQFRVPLIFWHGGDKIPRQRSARVTQHVDIFPSVVDFLDVPLDDLRLLPFGRSVFDESRPGVAVNHVSGHYWFRSEQIGTTWRMADESRGDLPGFGASPSEREAVDPYSRLRALVQFFNNGINENSWYSR